MIDFPQKLFGEIILFIAKFDCFKKWTISDINRLFIPPIKNKQFKIWRNTNNKIIGFTTWAFFSKEVSEGYISGKRKIRPEEMKNFVGCFLTGTAAEITPVSQIADNNFKVCNVISELNEDYQNLVRKKSAA